MFQRIQITIKAARDTVLSDANDTVPSDELRYQVRALVKDGLPVIAAAASLGISLRTAFRAYYGEFQYTVLKAVDWGTPGTEHLVHLARRVREKKRAHWVKKTSEQQLREIEKKVNFDQQILPLVKDGFTDREIAYRTQLPFLVVKRLTTKNGFAYKASKAQKIKERKRSQILSLEPWLPEQNICKELDIPIRYLWVFKRKRKKEKENNTKKYNRANYRFVKKKK